MSDPESLDAAGIPADVLTPFLSCLVQDFPVGVALFDREGRYIFVNEALARMNGMPAEAHLGCHPSEVLDIPAQRLDSIFQRVNAGEHLDWELAGETAREPGATGYWHELWYPVRDEAGAIIAQLAVVIETTEQKQAEQELQRVAALRQQLVEVASHELRGPLTSVMGFAQRLLRRGNLDPEVHEGIEIIYRQALEMAFRMDLFLGLSDVDDFIERERDVSTEKVVLDRLVQDEVRALRARRPEAAVELDLDEELAVASDSHRIRQIVANLLDNGVKYGGGVLRVAVRRSGGECVIEIRDFGPGIAEEDREKIFMRGYRTDETAQTALPGRGLGLFVARRLAERLGGALSLESQIGEGTAFYLRLPYGE